MISEPKKLTDLQREVLEALAVRHDWARPMDVGGRDGSHHSATLTQLAKLGLAERKKLHAIYCYNGSTHRQHLVDNRWIVTDGHPPSTGCCCKGSCRYRITAAGRKVVAKAAPETRQKPTASRKIMRTRRPRQP